MRRYALRDDQWDRIKDILPGKEGHVGVTAKDNRLFVEAVLYRYRAGMPWRDLPERFGDPIKITTRMSLWARTRTTVDKTSYKGRHLIENFGCKLKEFRAIATRYEKTARNFLAGIHLVASVTLLTKDQALAPRQFTSTHDR